GDGSPGAPPAGAHYTMFARVHGTPGGTDGAIVPVLVFQIAPVVNLDDPCFIAFPTDDCLGPPTATVPGGVPYPNCKPGSRYKDVLPAAQLSVVQQLQQNVLAVVSYTTV